MKTITALRFLFSLLSMVAFTSLQAQYCVPPGYNSGPYTGITLVKAGSINSITSSADGYRDFTASAGTFTVARGSNTSITLECYYSPDMVSIFTGHLNIRVWIDWNGDMDFNDAGEVALAKEMDCSGSNSSNPLTKATYVFSVPATAKLGATRMRVYEDMMPSDGHEEPNPCGYDAGIGQHGECEDYKIMVSDVTGLSGLEQDIQVAVYPNPANQVLHLQTKGINGQVQLNVYNICGSLIQSTDATIENNTLNLNLQTLSAGVYVLQLNNAEGIKINTTRFIKN
ncbi:MAG: T9SS type A sorting domain-containing protein [Bacteroidia bacterium]|jgi:hypothetical protein